MVFTITEDDDDDTYQFQQPIVMELNAFGSHATFTVPEPADDSSSLCWALLLLVLTIFVPCFGLFGCVYVATLSLARAHVMRYLLSHRSSGPRC